MNRKNGGWLSLKFENKSIKMRILTVPTLNLRPGMNAAAFSTYIVKFTAF